MTSFRDLTDSLTYADVPVGVQAVTRVTVAGVSAGRALALPVATDVPARLTHVRLWGGGG